VSKQRLTYRLKGISVLLFAGGEYRPYPLAPAHPAIAACSLRDSPVNHNKPNLWDILGSLTMSLEGGFEELEEFFSS